MPVGLCGSELGRPGKASSANSDRNNNTVLGTSLLDGQNVACLPGLSSPEAST